MGQHFKVIIGLLHRFVWVCGLVVDGWVVFGVVVCPIVAAFIPVVTELLFRFLALEPP